jgi:hypothetical protein
MQSQANLLQLVKYPFLVARFWLDAFFVPSAHQFYAGGRMGIGPSESFGFWYWLNLCVVIILLFNAARCAVLQLKNPENDALRIVTLVAMLAFGYAALFAAGRVAENGPEFALHTGLYVAYPFSVFVVLILGVFLRFEPIYRFRLLTVVSSIVSIVFIGLMQWYPLASVDDRMRIHYANDNALYRSVLSSVAAAPNPYTFTFSFKEPCSTNRVLPWLWNETIAEATFPRWYRAKGGEVTLKCPVADPELRPQ